MFSWGEAVSFGVITFRVHLISKLWLFSSLPYVNQNWEKPHMQNTTHPILSPSIERNYFNQVGSLACRKKRKSIAIVLNTSDSNWLVENQPWRSERQWAAMKSSFESQPDIKLAFLCAGRERKWGDPTEERWGGRAESQRLACSRSTCRGEPGRHLDCTAGAGNGSLTHTNTRTWTSEGPEIECRDRLYTLIQLQRRRARTDKRIAQVIRQLTAKVGKAAAQKSARQQLMLLVWSFNTDRESEEGWKTVQSQRRPRGKPIHVTATALQPTVNIHH